MDASLRRSLPGYAGDNFLDLISWLNPFWLSAPAMGLRTVNAICLKPGDEEARKQAPGTRERLNFLPLRVPDIQILIF